MNNPVVLAVVLQVVAVGVIIAEFIIPSMGLLSVTAASLMIYSLYVVFTKVGMGAGFVFMACDVAMVPALIFWGMQMLGKSAATLHSTLTSDGDGNAADASLAALVGKTGVVISNCRPAGRALIEGKKYDVVTTGDFLEESLPVVVKEVSGNRIVVVKVNEK